ncbi:MULTISPECIES: hypothetical protein [Lysobacter]|uniref:hypothetical protein n=1 Tax=Lysobacter TaxID=68 RepID=UPI001F162A71|nr:MULTISPECIES: hypothetical protein [Lysobacter]UJB18836.1 hypothetical protein L1A79_21360 [Lysobacter capsici]UJQ27439.1 hypothetical protein L2D09_18525 [Lysobacter gummosus]
MSARGGSTRDHRWIRPRDDAPDARRATKTKRLHRHSPSTKPLEIQGHLVFRAGFAHDVWCDVDGRNIQSTSPVFLSPIFIFYMRLIAIHRHWKSASRAQAATRRIEAAPIRYANSCIGCSRRRRCAHHRDGDRGGDQGRDGDDEAVAASIRQDHPAALRGYGPGNDSDGASPLRRRAQKKTARSAARGTGRQKRAHEDETRKTP